MIGIFFVDVVKLIGVGDSFMVGFFVFFFEG